MILSFEKYHGKKSLDENVSAAKSFLLKNATEAKRKKMGLNPEDKIVFTPEEEKKILDNPAYLEVRDYFLNTVKKPGLVYPFTYFRIKEKLPMRISDQNGYSVENLERKMEEASPLLSTFPLPLGNIENYIKTKQANPSFDDRPAYEILYDDIALILSKKSIKEFIDNFVGPIRREFAESLKLKDSDSERSQLLDRIYHVVYDLKNLKPILNDKTGKEETAEEQIIRYGSKYKDTRTYPEFRDSYVAFKEFVRDCEDKVKGWGSGINEFIEDLKSIAPSIKILYFDPVKKIVVTSARSAEGMRSVCKIANATYCIRTDSTFWTYTSGRLQISVSLLDLPKTDERYLTSLTIDRNGKVVDSANRSNVRINQGDENYLKLLKRYLSIPLEDINIISDSIEKNFTSELSIKKIVQSIEKKNTKDSAKLIYALGSIGMQQAIEQGEYSREEMDIFKNIIITIIRKDNNITYDEIVKAYNNDSEGGFFTLEDVKLFETLTEGKYNKQDVADIMALTDAAQEPLKSTMVQITNEKAIKMIQFVIDSYPEVKDYVESKLL
jgi:hypothetical protein